MDPLLTILKRLLDQQVDLVMVGGMAAMFHGSPLVTQDIDFSIPFDAPTFSKVLSALRDVRPTFRQRPDRLPLWDDPERLAKLNVLLVETDLGNVDFIRDVTGVGSFQEAYAQSESVEVAPGISCRILNLDALIAAKRAAGRPKDVTGVHHLEAIRKALGESKPPNAPKTPDSGPPPGLPV